MRGAFIAEIDHFQQKRHIMHGITLTEDSIVERRVIIGTRKAGAVTISEKNHRPIYKGDLQATTDKLSKLELKAVQKGVQNDTPRHRATYERTMQKRHDGFKKDK